MRIKVLFFLIFVLIISFFGCTKAIKNETEKESITIRWGEMKNYNPVFIAKEKGFFEEEGLNVDFVATFNSGPDTVKAAGSNNIDAGHSAISGIINAVNSGVEVIGVADSQSEFIDAPLMQWFVLENSSIKEPKDLKGKKIGVNSLSGSFYYTCLEYLEQNGIEKEEVEFVLLPHKNQEQALRNNQIDVAGIIDPFSIAIQKNGGVRILFRAVDVLGEIQFSNIFFTKKFVMQNPEAVKRFVNAYNKAIDFIQDNPTEAARIMAKELGLSEDIIVPHRYTENASVKMDSVQYWMDIMRANGELQDNGKLKVEDVATEEFSKSILEY